MINIINITNEEFNIFLELNKDMINKITQKNPTLEEFDDGDVILDD